jgi:HEAT repeat protein
MKKVCLFLLFFSFLYATEEEIVKRVQAHFLIEDYFLAKEEAKRAFSQYPDSEDVHAVYVQALSAFGEEKEAIVQLSSFLEKYQNEQKSKFLLEEVSWGILKEGTISSQYAVRLASMIGVFLTRDVRAVEILKEKLDDSNAIIRNLAIQLSCYLKDYPLKEKIKERFKVEKIWYVKHELIKAIGQMKIREMGPTLLSMLSDNSTTYEEKGYIIQTLLHMYEKMEMKDWLPFCLSKKYGLREFACKIAYHLEIDEAKEDVIDRISDPHPQVRIAALQAFALYYMDKCDKEKAQQIIKKALKDVDPQVAIVAAWVSFIAEPQSGEYHIKKWLLDKRAENRRLAAAALAACGQKGESLSLQMMRSAKDPYVKINLAMGLISQRSHIKEASDILYSFLHDKKELWMWKNSFFEVLSPSELTHVEHIPRYPEAIDQLTHLNLLSVLALVEDSRAQEGLKNFLKKKDWQITGAAMVILLQEGDERTIEGLNIILQDEDPAIRIQAAILMAMVGKVESTAQILKDTYVSADYDKKAQILEALGAISKSDEAGFFVKAFFEPFQVLRIIGASSCIQCLNR